MKKSKEIQKETCVVCGKEVHEVTGKYTTSMGVLCRDDYLEKIGEEIEKRPIKSYV